jgi:RNA 2',3'-cyclic 3'-phosphodiesterase
MRLFTAIELPDALRQRLAGVGPDLVERRWGVDARLHHVTFTRSENLHVTVKFLGEVPDVAAVSDAIRVVVPRPGPLALNLTGLEFFPQRGPIRVIAAKVGGDTDPLLSVQAHIEDACAGLGIAREARPYQPHVTIARCKHGFPAHLRQPSQGAEGLARDSAWVTDAVVLMESRLHPTAPQYLPVARFSLLKLQ